MLVVSGGDVNGPMLDHANWLVHSGRSMVVYIVTVSLPTGPVDPVGPVGLACPAIVEAAPGGLVGPAAS